MAKSDKREQIIKAAWDFFTTRRFHEATVDEVAEAAGVGKGTIYRYFADKEELFLETLFDGLEALNEQVAATMKCSKDPLICLRALVVNLVAFFEERRDFLSIIHTIENRPDADAGKPVRRMFWQRWHQKRETVVELIDTLLKDGITRGVIRPMEDTRFAANLLLGTIRTILRSASDMDTKMRIDMTLDLYLRGIATGKDAHN